MSRNPLQRALSFVLAIACLMMMGCSSVQSREAQDWAGYTEVGTASFYADTHEGKKTASGERYNHGRKTAAHPDLPFGTKLKVTNVKTGKSVIVKVNDRGPVAHGRAIDLSESAFARIASTAKGLVRVRIEVIS